MYAIEFESKVDNGALKIPAHYKRVMQCDKVRVIIMIENETEGSETATQSQKSPFDSFLKMSKNIDHLNILSRDDLHDR
jgi:hypothetical protein